jgi:uncharacterized protein YxjI
MELENSYNLARTTAKAHLIVKKITYFERQIEITSSKLNTYKIVGEIDQSPLKLNKSEEKEGVI